MWLIIMWLICCKCCCCWWCCGWNCFVVVVVVVLLMMVVLNVVGACICGAAVWPADGARCAPTPAGLRGEPEGVDAFLPGGCRVEEPARLFVPSTAGPVLPTPQQAGPVALAPRREDPRRRGSCALMRIWVGSGCKSLPVFTVCCHNDRSLPSHPSVCLSVCLGKSLLLGAMPDTLLAVVLMWPCEASTDTHISRSLENGEGHFELLKKSLLEYSK